MLHAQEGREMHVGLWWVKVKERDKLQEPGAYGRMILKWLLKKYDGGALIEIKAADFCKNTNEHSVTT